ASSSTARSCRKTASGSPEPPPSDQRSKSDADHDGRDRDRAHQAVSSPGPVFGNDARQVIAFGAGRYAFMSARSMVKLDTNAGKLDAFKGRITVIPGATDDREVIKRAVAGCDGILVVMTPRGVHGHSTGTTQAVLDYAPPGARLIFSCGWHITLDGQDVYSLKLKILVKVFGPLARLARFADLDDQVEAARRIFASDTQWTVVRGSDLEEGDR